VTDDNSTCARCKGTAIDPEHSELADGTSEEPYLEPCTACQYPDVPLRPVTDQEIDALPIVDLDQQFLAMLDEVIDVEAGLQQILDRAKEA
jgi:hypothetical protein